MRLLSRLKSLLVSGNARSSRAKKNILASVIIKGLNIAIGIVFVPLFIEYLDPAKYGIWITLSSVIAWFSFFNIGLGNGLRNRLAESLALNDIELGQRYVSTTYTVVAIIFIILIAVFALANAFLDWADLLNAPETVSSKELGSLAFVVFTFFCLRMILQLIDSVVIADQKSALASLLSLISKFITLIAVLILKHIGEGSLFQLGFILSFSPVIVLGSANVILFKGKYREYRPSRKAVDFFKAKDLFSLGIKFFFIQISALLLYQTNNIIISRIFGPDQVTPYNIAFKYFSMITFGFSTVLVPFWSAFTEAWTISDLHWIKQIISKLTKLWFILLIVGLIMLLSSQWIYNIWIGESVSVSFSLSLLVFIWVMINAWNGIYSHLLNGIGKIKLQLIIGFIAAIINIPIAIFLGHLIGLEGVLIANLIVLVPSIIIYPRQYRKLISGNATGIWDK